MCGDHRAVQIDGKMLGRKIRSSLLTEMLTSTDKPPSGVIST
jgi:hypothetical protein